ncbi:FecR family protein [Microbulbifer taiwanensis]|uniref:FecR family protein n=1 Tax=Microbulbifer taiwanensis TaxID=986746 RepID=A0ABW1YLN3_9GAMM|nr:FecR domain-containing protein [Microbulbifer taiwanensis]
MKRAEVIDESIRAAAADWFARQRSGAMSARECEALEHWLQEDARHQLAFAQCRQLWLMTDMLADDPELSGELEALRKQARRTPRWRALVQIAAVFLVAVAAMLVQRHFSVDYYQTGIGGQQLVHLDDGSTLMLNTGSRVGVRYTGAQRSIYLERGEAFFMVAKNPQRPFVVHAAGSEVRALGTAFNVALRSGDIRVAVTQGLVEVNAEDTAGKRRSLAKLHPGQGLRYVAGDPPAEAEVSAVNLEKVTAWQASKIYFDNERLENAIAEYNRYTTRKMVLVGDTLAGERISGVFNIGDADALAFALEESFGARIDKGDRRILILPGRD